MFYTYYKQRKNDILLRFKEDGKTKTKVVDFYKPSLYISAINEADFCGKKSIHQEKLKEVVFDNIYQARMFGEQYKAVENIGLNGNSNYANQFIIDACNGKTPDYVDAGIALGFFDIEVDAPEFPDPEKAKWPVNAISMYNTKTDECFVLTLKPAQDSSWTIQKSPKKISTVNISYHQYSEEKSLLDDFLSLMSTFQYDIISGWNSEGFDIPYLINRMKKFFDMEYIQKKWSPFNEITQRKIVNKFGKTQTVYSIVGLSHLDYMNVYKKHTYNPRESYKLDYIAHVELDERKISYEESKSIHNLYHDNFQKFVDYNINDTLLLVNLEKKLGLFPLIYAITYDSLSNFEDTMGSVKMVEQLFAKYLYGKDMVPPFNREQQTQKEFIGAYVVEPPPGLFKWIVSFDLNSLYPHVTMQYNIGIDTWIPHDKLPPELAELKKKYTFDDLLTKSADITPLLKKYNVTMAPNFEFYRLDIESFAAGVQKELYSDRKSVKQDMLDAQRHKVNAETEESKKEWEIKETQLNNMQLGKKVLLNSIYGAGGNNCFLYYKVENAEAITLGGQLTNKWTTARIEPFVQKLLNTDHRLHLAGDTDSMYITFSNYVDCLDTKKMSKDDIVNSVDKFCHEVIRPRIESTVTELSEYLNCAGQYMHWGREVIAESGIFVAKKRYCLKVLDSEGTRYSEEEPKYKIVGLEAIKSSTPEWSRVLLKELYELALDNKKEELQDRCMSIREQFNKSEIADIAISSSISNIDKYYVDGAYKSGCPKHVRGAINHNLLLERLGIKNTHPIVAGDHIKFVDLKMPNPTGQPVIAFDTFVPEKFITELHLDEFVDKDALFQRSFENPLQILLGALKWKKEKELSLF